MPDVWSIYFALSLAPIIPLVLTAIAHTLPSRLTSLSSTSRAGPLGLSLMCIEIVRSGKAMLSHQVLLGVRGGDESRRVRTMCEVDTALSVYLLTALVAHLPIISFSLLKSQPKPTHPTPSPPRALHLLPLIYTYALIPVLPIVADAGMKGSDTQQLHNIGEAGIGGGFGVWWGMYCIEGGSWWRIARPASLAPPLILTLPLALALLASLYSRIGHPSIELQPSVRTAVAAVILLVGAAGGIAYLVLEQVQGWSTDWWPRVFESLPSFIILAVYASHLGLWRTYSHWLRLSRPPPASHITPTNDPFFLPKSSFLSAPKRPTSSFYAPPTPPRIYRSPTVREKGATASEKDIPTLKMRYFTESVHSVDSIRPLSPLSIYSKATHLAAPAYYDQASTRGSAPGGGPTAWRSGSPAAALPSGLWPDLIDPRSRSTFTTSTPSARNTLRSILGLSRPSTRHHQHRRSSTGSPPFTWSVSASERDSVPPTYLAVPAPVHRKDTGVRPDDASSVSRYSLTSVQTPVGYRDTYLEMFFEASRDERISVFRGEQGREDFRARDLGRKT